MTTFVVVSVRDQKADVYGRPAFLPSRGVALRQFTDEVNRRDETNEMARHPEDFSLLFLGTYDDLTGTFDCGRPEQMAIGSDCVRPVAK